MKNTPNRINIAIFDDHKLFLEGMLVILDGDYDVNIQIKALDGKELIDKIEEQSSNLPDICLLGINSSYSKAMNSYETLKHLKQKWPFLNTLVLSTFENEYTVFQFLKLGANGYISKNVDSKELLNAIKQVASEGFYNSQKVAKTLYKSVLTKNSKVDLNMSDREILFLSFCCTDLSYSEIAKRLNISTSSAEKCRDALFEKFNLHSRVSLAVFAVTSGLCYLADAGK